MKEQTNKEVAAYLRDFELRESKLLAEVKQMEVELPERLKNWRLWIGDSQLYLNELRNFVEIERGKLIKMVAELADGGPVNGHGD